MTQAPGWWLQANHRRLLANHSRLIAIRWRLPSILSVGRQQQRAVGCQQPPMNQPTANVRQLFFSFFFFPFFFQPLTRQTSPPPQRNILVWIVSLGPDEGGGQFFLGGGGTGTFLNNPEQPWGSHGGAPLCG